MRILFAYTDINIKGGELNCNHGIATLSAILKQAGHQINLVYLYGKYDPQILTQQIASFRPDLLAFSSMSAQFRYVKRLLQDLDQKHRRGLLTICGGVHPTSVPECLEETDGLDAICIGEGEHALLEFVEALEQGRDHSTVKGFWVKDNGKIHKNPSRDFITDLDSIPFGDLEIFDYQKIINSNYGRARFFVTRGCPYNCYYCCNHVFRGSQSGKYVRFRSIENVIREMETVLSKYSVKVIFVEDDTFTMKEDFVYEFCDQYKKRIKLPLMMHTRAETVTLDMFKKLKDAGCYRVAIGVESGNSFIRNKVLNRKMSNEQIIKAFKIAKEVGMVTKSFNIVGFPFETETHFKNTIKLNQEINPDLLVINTFDPYPGTKLYEVCKEKRFLTNLDESDRFIPRTDTVLNMPQFSRERILKCYRNFAFNVYKKHSLPKAILYRIYYSRYGEDLIKLLSPIKDYLFSFVEGKKSKGAATACRAV
ncbi:hypothetical protein LCGC14_1699660 [marine sediment metagenome]|uniref:Uncharacterized protein n=1 Tax=marine sediment metagenome TaxID=412755 RepID=A0A0F9HI42_9ZZZZ